MSTYDLRTAFYNKLLELTYANLVTLKPDEIFDARESANNVSYRRGTVLLGIPKTEGFGHGVYSRTDHIYQIDLWVPRSISSPLKHLDTLADGHLVHFFPANGRGLTVTENTTSGNIVRRPSITNFGREGSYLRAMVEVDFYTEHLPS